MAESFKCYHLILLRESKERGREGEMERRKGRKGEREREIEGKETERGWGG